MKNKPIGIFDSGMGGLTVRAEIARRLPTESLLYFGDGANVPYGPRPKEEIVAFVDRAVDTLTGKGIKMLVVACNAATGAAIDRLRAKYDIPIIGMEPAVKPAALTTETGVIGVLATAAAFNGALYKATAAAYRDRVRIIETVGEGFVELVENDREETPEALETVRRALEPMLAAGTDRIVLGCTHYPYLVPQIRRVIDDWANDKALSSPNTKVDSRAVQIIDSATAIARRVESLLGEHDLRASPGHTPDRPIARSGPHHEFLSFAGDNYLAHLVRKSVRVPK